ncbi:MAG TPA: tRNA 2-thiouridine(34) synthase MnmA [Bacteroidales bacterium]|nr:tRNA 2-thiouridine(34) synthase MnmA [Bacteroidales bacterium]
MPQKGSVLVAMSGGVDSSVACLMLMEQGYSIIGATFRTWDYIAEGCLAKNTGCCSIEAIHDAAAFAAHNRFEHHVLDFRDSFRKLVIDNFVDEYQAGRTPNPCVICNAKIKWGLLLEKAKELGCSHIATGHYAGIGMQHGRFFLKTARDLEKDQTYFLWQLTSEQLSKTLFPLSRYTKNQIKAMALEAGYKQLSSKRESQEICFVPDNNYCGFITKEYPQVMSQINEGELLDTMGNTIGKHRGYIHYTIGQRKGIGYAAGHPLYVINIDANRNTLTLGTKEELYRDQLTVSGLTLNKYDDFTCLENIIVKIRYNSKGTEAVLTKEGNRVHVVFQLPVMAVTPGQSAVFYEGTDLIGGGIIE